MQVMEAEIFGPFWAAGDAKATAKHPGKGEGLGQIPHDSGFAGTLTLSTVLVKASGSDRCFQ